MNHFETDFADAVREFVGEDGRLVVFVDDLDRCTPESAMTVLESLKLFLAHSQCVFVLAMDVDVLAAIATNKFGESLKGALGRRRLRHGLPRQDRPTAVLPAGRGVRHPPRGLQALCLGAGGRPPLLGAAPARPGRQSAPSSSATSTSSTWHWPSPAPSCRPYRIDREYRLQLAVLLIIRTLHRGFFHALSVDPESWQTLVRWFEQVQINPIARQNTLQLPEHLRDFASDSVLERLFTHSGGERLRPPYGSVVQEMISTLRSTAAARPLRSSPEPSGRSGRRRPRGRNPGHRAPSRSAVFVARGVVEGVWTARAGVFAFSRRRAALTVCRSVGRGWGWRRAPGLPAKWILLSSWRTAWSRGVWTARAGVPAFSWRRAARPRAGRSGPGVVPRPGLFGSRRRGSRPDRRTPSGTG
ncbi:P-loop NTPase fold protein [Streptomyces lasalocidi]